jgi:hypothetical protein
MEIAQESERSEEALFLNLIRATGVTEGQEVIYDSQVTNRRQRGHSARAHSPLAHSYWSPGSHINLKTVRNTQKHQHKQVDALLFD